MKIFVILNAARVGRGIFIFDVKNGSSEQDFSDRDLGLIDVDIVDDEMEDLIMIDVECIICLKTMFSLGLKIYNPKNILSKSPAPCE